MAEKQGKSKLPFGASPVTLVIVGIGIILLAVVYLFPNLLGGGSPAPASAPVPRNAPPAVAAPPAAPAAPAKIGQVNKAQDVLRVSTADDELSSFLLKFGRSNPFATFARASAPSSSTTASRTDSTLDDLRRRVQNQPGGGSATAAPIRANEGFVLTGILNYQSQSLAVIVKDGRTYYVMAGEKLGKTGYTMKAINDTSVLVSSGEKELAVQLGGNKP